MRDDAVLLRWLLHVEQDGLCLIDGAPQQQGITRQICDRVAYPKLNYYGLVITTVKCGRSRYSFSVGLHVLIFHSTLTFCRETV